mgnify:CR=1 FL=1
MLVAPNPVVGLAPNAPKPPVAASWAPNPPAMPVCPKPPVAPNGFGWKQKKT